MALIHCCNCGATISDKAPTCPKCNTPTAPAQPVQQPAQQPTYQQPIQPTYPPHTQYPTEQIQNEYPTNLNNWNWGAFTFSWLWGAFNGVYWPLLLFLVLLIPFAGMFIFPIGALVIAIILGAGGNKMAWEKCKWRDAMQFQFVQRNWNIAAAITWGWLSVSIIGIIYAMATAAYTLLDKFSSLDRIFQ
ncbi:MAG: hypothetical protein RSA66_09160 [Muribaculaceae bacterium]